MAITTRSGAPAIKFGVVVMLALGLSACAGTPQAGQTSQASGNTGCDLTGSRIARTQNCTDSGLVTKAGANVGSGNGLAGNNAGGVSGQQGASSGGH